MTVTLAVDQLTADTQDLYLGTVEDQVHDRIPLIYKMRKMRKVITKGGKEIVKPLRYAKNTQTQTYVKGATLESGTNAKRTAAAFGWALTQTPIKYDVDDFIMNNGDEQIVDTIAEEVKSAQEDQVDTLSENMFNIYKGVEDSHTTAPAGQMLSIKAALIYEESTYHGKAIYGGITRTSTDDWFSGNVDDGTLGNSTTVSYHHWDYMVEQCMRYRGNRNNLLAVCGNVLYRKWKSLVRAKERDVNITGMMAKAGFESFTIDGVEIVLDDNCPASTFYMLDLNTWEWRINPKRNFNVTPFKWQGDVTNGIDEWLARVMLGHNFVCWKPRNNYVATSMS